MGPEIVADALAQAGFRLPRKEGIAIQPGQDSYLAGIDSACPPEVTAITLHV